MFFQSKQSSSIFVHDIKALWWQIRSDCIWIDLIYRHFCSKVDTIIMESGLTENCRIEENNSLTISGSRAWLSLSFQKYETVARRFSIIFYFFKGSIQLR